jgi:hypothetical protein
MTNKSRVSIPTHKWAEIWWRQIFSIIATYPSASPTKMVINDTRATLTSMRTTLPCKTCCHNWNTKLGRTPLTDDVMSSKAALLDWMCDRFREINHSRSNWSNSQISAYYINPLFDIGIDTVSHDIIANSRGSSMSLSAH